MTRMEYQFREGRDLFCLVQLHLQRPHSTWRVAKAQSVLKECMHACFFFAGHVTKPLQFHLLLVPYQTCHLISISLVPPESDPDPKLVRLDQPCRGRMVGPCCSISRLSTPWTDAMPGPLEWILPLSPGQVPSSVMLYIALLASIQSTW